MYSENDYRYYLAHGKWEWPNGKNSPAYNHDYYQKHKEKWKGYADSAKKKFKDSTGLTAREDYVAARRKADLDKMDVDYTRRSRNIDSSVLNRTARLTSELGGEPDAEGRKRVESDIGWLDENLYANSAGKRGGHTRSASESANAAANAKRKYEQTPLGKAEKAYDRGKKAFEDALKKLKR